MSDKIISHPSNDAYRAGWERAFGGKSVSLTDPMTGRVCEIKYEPIAATLPDVTHINGEMYVLGEDGEYIKAEH